MSDLMLETRILQLEATVEELQMTVEGLQHAIALALSGTLDENLNVEMPGDETLTSDLDGYPTCAKCQASLQEEFYRVESSDGTHVILCCNCYDSNEEGGGN